MTSAVVASIRSWESGNFALVAAFVLAEGERERDLTVPHPWE